MSLSLASEEERVSSARALAFCVRGKTVPARAHLRGSSWSRVSQRRAAAPLGSDAQSQHLRLGGGVAPALGHRRIRHAVREASWDLPQAWRPRRVGC